MPRILPSRGALLRRRTFVLPQISITTPVAPQPAGAPILVSGTYAGSPAAITLVWRQGGQDVSAPVAVTAIANGQWSGTILTPAQPGIYVLRAAFDDATPTADTDPIEITAATPAMQATLVFEGTGTTTDTIALCGHAFPRGMLFGTDPVVLRRTDTQALLRTQLNPLATWPDGSVKTALLAAELPALAGAATLATELRVGEAHPDPGTNLSFASALTGRSAAIEVFANPSGSTPDLIVNPLDGIGSPDWWSGPLAISTRREYQLASSVTGVTSVRLVVDVIVTKDGVLWLDVEFRNDRVMHASGGTATFGFVIKIDGATVYTQKPVSGPARQLPQYDCWLRRFGRSADGARTYGRGFAEEEPVYYRPDLPALARAGVQEATDQTQAIAAASLTQISNDLAAGADKTSDPWWPWGWNRDAGAVGGRQEIGYRTLANAVWLHSGTRNAIILSHRQLEVYAALPIHYYDWELGRWLNPVDWPLMSTNANWSSAAGTPRATAQGLPTSQRPTNNATDHIGVDHAHHPSAAAAVALLSGRRMAYDHLAARASWVAMDRQWRHNGVLLSDSPAWRTQTQNLATGVAWGPRLWVHQTRDFSWDTRCLIDAANLLPDNYEGSARVIYNQNLEAVFNVIKHMLPSIRALLPDTFGFPIIHAAGDWVMNYMQSFIYYSLATAYRAGLGGEHAKEVIHELIKFRVNAALDGGFPYRNVLSGDNIHVRTLATSTYAQTWAEAWAMTSPPVAEILEDYSTGGGLPDYQKNVVSGLATLYQLDLPPELHAKVADALILFRSMRQNLDAHPIPRLMPEEFMTGLQTNAVLTHGMSWRWDSAPVVVPGQSFEIAGNAEAGAAVGVVRFTGCIPRGSHYGYTPSAKAWEITSQPEGDPFEITLGGALRLAGNPPAAGTVNVTVRPRTYNYGRIPDGDPSGTLILGEPETVSITVTAAAAQIVSVVPTSPQQVANTAAVGTVIYTVTARGNAPITPSIQSGNTTLFEFVHAGRQTYEVRTKAALSINTYPLTLRVTNAHGHDDVSVSIQVTAPAAAPVIGAGQTFEFAETLATGVAADPATVAYTGDPPNSATFTAGNTGDRLALAIDNGDVLLTNAAALRKHETATYTPTVRLANVGGEDSKTITVNVFQPWVMRTSAPSAHYIGIWGVARRLVDSYTGPLIRVRRASDNAEQDIGFTASGGHHVLDESAITAFVGSNNWFVVTVYDQSLQGFHLSQANTSKQPTGGTSGGFNRIGSNNRAAMDMNGQRLVVRTGCTLPMATSHFALYGAVRFGTTFGTSEHVFRTDGSGNHFRLNVPNGAPRLTVGNGVLLHGSAYSTEANAVFGGRFQHGASSPNRLRLFCTGIGGAALNHGNTQPAVDNMTLQIGSDFSGNDQWRGRIGEVVLLRDLAIADEAEVLANAAAFYGV